MNHWIVQIASKHGHQFAHLECETEPKLGDSLGGGRTHVVAIDVGPFDTPEAAWVAWHKKRQTVLV
jgi:hypothetical protein